LVKCAKENCAGMISSRMINYYNRKIMDNAGHLMLNTGEILPIGHGESISLHNSLKENIGACAGACLYNVEMLQDIGYFDEYFDTGYEDAELGLRATLVGYKCLYEPKAIVYHKMGNSIGKIFDYDYVLKVQKNILYTYFKLMPLVNILLSAPLILFRYISMSLIYLFFGKWYFLKIIWHSLKDLISVDGNKILITRKQFNANRSLLSINQIHKKQIFFLLLDINRFRRIFIRKEQSAFETYGRDN